MVLGYGLGVGEGEEIEVAGGYGDENDSADLVDGIGVSWGLMMAGERKRTSTQDTRSTTDPPRPLGWGGGRIPGQDSILEKQVVAPTEVRSNGAHPFFHSFSFPINSSHLPPPSSERCSNIIFLSPGWF